MSDAITKDKVDDMIYRSELTILFHERNKDLLCDETVGEARKTELLQARRNLAINNVAKISKRIVDIYASRAWRSPKPSHVTWAKNIHDRIRLLDALLSETQIWGQEDITEKLRIFDLVNVAASHHIMELYMLNALIYERAAMEAYPSPFRPSEEFPDRNPLLHAIEKIAERESEEKEEDWDIRTVPSNKPAHN